MPTIIPPTKKAPSARTLLAKAPKVAKPKKPVAEPSRTIPAERHRKYTNIKRGVRPDLPSTMAFRSAWEANIARIFQLANSANPAVQWSFESWSWQRSASPPMRFWFRGELTKNSSILVDFQVSWVARDGRVLQAFIEVKGLLRRGGRLDKLDDEQWEQLRHVDPDSATRLRRFLKQYPALAPRTFLIGAEEYRALERRYASKIPGWEY